MDERFNLLRDLLSTPSPTGNEYAVQRLLRRRVEPNCNRCDSDVHGNLFLGLRPDAKRVVMLTAHCDQIGFMIRNIDADGYLHVDVLGGADDAALPGASVVVLGREGQVPGVFGKAPVHLESKSDRSTTPTLGRLWIDIGARNREEAEELVRPGDYATFFPQITELRNGRIAAPGLDDKAGLFAVVDALLHCADRGTKSGLWVVSTVQEEIGLRGATTAAFNLRPHIAIAVDVTFATDDPGGASSQSAVAKFRRGPCISHGPNTSPVVEELLVAAAERAEVPYQITASAELEGNESKALQVTGSGLATASVGIPIRNMHTQAEVCDLQDVEHTARLLAEFVRSLDEDVDLRPLHASSLGAGAE